MSSLAATQADGYYIPPTYLTSGAYTRQSLSKFAGSKGHNQYLTRSVVRFELPYDGVCTGCSITISKGTRFNAKKSREGEYHSSAIYEFVTSCRKCQMCKFRIRTNPKERCFDYISGIRRKVLEFDSTDAGTRGVVDTDFGVGFHEYRDGGLVNAVPEEERGVLDGVETVARGRRVAETEREMMEGLIRMNEVMGVDYDANAALRREAREERKGRRGRREEASGKGLGRGIEMMPLEEGDKQMAREVWRMRRGKGSAHREEREGLRQAGGSIFGGRKRTPEVAGIDVGRLGGNDCAERKSVLPRGKKTMRTEKKEGVLFSSGGNSVLSALAGYGSDSD